MIGEVARDGRGLVHTGNGGGAQESRLGGIDMKLRLAAITLLLSGLLAGTTFAADPSGTWRWEHEDLEGSGEMVPDVLKLKMVDGKVTGTYLSPDGELPIENASLDGDTLHWELNIDAQGQNLNIAWTGKISGDDVEGTLAFGDFGEFPWTAKRDAATDPSGTWRWEHPDLAGSGEIIPDILKLKVEDGKVTGTYVSPDGEQPIENVSLDGDTLHWELNIDAEGQNLNIAWTGKISGDDVVGTVTLGDFGEFPWTAKRDAKVAANPTGTWRWEHDDPTTGQSVKDVLKIESALGKVGGSYEMGGVAYKVNNGKINGNTLSWEFDLEIEGQVINIQFSGDISGDDVEGTVALGDFGEFPWTAKRDAKMAAEAAGTWRWEHDDPGTGQSVKDVLKLTMANGKLGGSYEMGGVMYEVNNSKLDGSTLTWDFDIDAEGQVLNISFSGDISGDAVTGTVNIGDFGEFPWDAKRD